MLSTANLGPSPLVSPVTHPDPLDFRTVTVGRFPCYCWGRRSLASFVAQPTCVTGFQPIDGGLRAPKRAGLHKRQIVSNAPRTNLFSIVPASGPWCARRPHGTGAD